MKEFKQRVIEENKELCEKIDSLRAFIAKQFVAMMKYSSILMDRIGAFK